MEPGRVQRTYHTERNVDLRIGAEFGGQERGYRPVNVHHDDGHDKDGQVEKGREYGVQHGQTDGNEQTAETPNTTPNPDGNNGQGTDKK